eukprot:CAMPEP_0197303082 /NCGR_PEP_ID=MMETSP0890-20130614/51446_1 /TAXON_ID=44058 ORGANISM="Aureoumbra lagunensis, Strain CCMP1510" /NCGR_SAMPLE_ID=MMETSP0890 /ASSEMBLY_ACC=CAM_ASM_000533 /LENGTH=35 /DNA_ID= /DNA_START= /DNA_END= /DNA_ORIENTATION=
MQEATSTDIMTIFDKCAKGSDSRRKSSELCISSPD